MLKVKTMENQRRQPQTHTAPR